MKYLLLLLLPLTSIAQIKTGMERMLELMNVSVPITFEKGFSKDGSCPEINFRVKSLPKKEKIELKFFIDEDGNKAFDEREPSSDVAITKKKSIRPLLDIKSARKQFNFKTTKESILYLTSDYRFMSGTVFGDYEDLEAKKTYKNCVYYVHQEIKK